MTGIDRIQFFPLGMIKLLKTSICNLIFASTSDHRRVTMCWRTTFDDRVICNIGISTAPRMWSLENQCIHRRSVKANSIGMWGQAM